MNTVEQLEKRVAELQEELVRQEKLASLGKLTAGIMHEIRNPLNFVINFNKVSASLVADIKDVLEPYTDSMSQDDQDDLDDILADLDSNFKSIDEQGSRALSIIQNILLSSRGKEGEFIPTDVPHIVKEYVALAYHAMRANYNGFNATIHETYPDSMPQADIVPQDVNRAVLNVVNNAFYAIWQRAQEGEPGYQPTLDVEVAQSADNVVITIADNGPGMSDAVKQHLYEAFYTTKPAGHGTGLGMSITRDIIEKTHKGTITFSSTQGQGTTFTITLPLHHH